jgi:hypothetical protein
MHYYYFFPLTFKEPKTQYEKKQLSFHSPSVYVIPEPIVTSFHFNARIHLISPSSHHTGLTVRIVVDRLVCKPA